MGTDNIILLEVTEWFDQTGRELVHRILEKDSGEIKFGGLELGKAHIWYQRYNGIWAFLFFSKNYSQSRYYNHRTNHYSQNHCLYIMSHWILLKSFYFKKI